jgi:hypothetical protein
MRLQIAEDGRDGEVRYFGEIENSPDAVKKFVTKLSPRYDQLHFCYEAGPTGYGVPFLVAATFVAEVGDVRRFTTPQQLMAFLGLVPSERTTGDMVRRGSITKTGNSRARRVLVEAACRYRRLIAKGKKRVVTTTAIACEIAACPSLAFFIARKMPWWVGKSLEAIAR